MAEHPIDHHIMFRLGQIHTMVKQIHSQTCTKQSPGFSKEKLIQYVQLLLKALRVFGPLLQPYILAWLSWIGAGVVLGWKLVMKLFAGS